MVGSSYRTRIRRHLYHPWESVLSVVTSRPVPFFSSLSWSRQSALLGGFVAAR